DPRRTVQLSRRARSDEAEVAGTAGRRGRIPADRSWQGRQDRAGPADRSGPMTRLSADEARELGHTVRAACERLATEERVREIAYGDSGGDSYDTELWRVLCRQVGVGAIALPEEAGGAGYGARALGVVAHELGRALAPVPFLASTVLATGLLVDTGVDEQLLAGLIDGERTATAVLTERAGSWNRNAVAAVASHNSNGWSLRGTAHH